MNEPLTPNEKENLLEHTAPCRQKQAKAYLRGQVPGVKQHYAPDATADPEQGWVESDETVHRLAHWREDSPY